MDNKLRVGIWLGSKPYGGGVFQYSLLTVLALSEVKKKNPEKYDLILFSPTEEWKTFIEESFANVTFDFVIVRKHLAHKIVGRLLRYSDVGLRFWRAINRFFPFVYRAFCKAQADLVICPSQDALSYEIKLPTISTIHDLMHRYEPDFPESSEKKEFRRRERNYRRMCRFSKVILVDSELGQRQVVESYGDVLNAKLMVLPYLPPPYVLNHNPATDFSYVRDKYGLADKYIFYPAQFWRHKNHHGLVQAIKLLRQRGVIVNAVFSGSVENNYEHVLKLIEEFALHKQIKILGYVPNDDLVGLYKNATALVMPTFFGPTNIPPLEAMFLGVPIVCSNVYAMPEQVGGAGLLFDPNNVDDIAEKVLTVWTGEKLRKDLVRKGYERIKDMTLENHAKHWEEAIGVACQ